MAMRSSASPRKSDTGTPRALSLSTRYSRSEARSSSSSAREPRVTTCVAGILTVGLLSLVLFWLATPAPAGPEASDQASPRRGRSLGQQSSSSGGGGGSSVDPYILRRFPHSGVCDRRQYPDSVSLRADLVTILVNGFSESRIPLLQHNMRVYSEFAVVDAIFVLWGNTSTPQHLLEGEGWATQAGSAPIKVVRQRSESLNDRFLPRKFIRTRAVVICDDDITVDYSTLEFALKVWGENEQRIVGFFPRAHVFSMESKAWSYTKLPDRYSIMLTKLMILHTDYLFEYTCHTPPGVKEFVDAGSNCEDIAMNFVVSKASGLGPLLVAGQARDWGDTRNSETELSVVGLSARAGHKKNRGGCITSFQRMWGGMELRYSYGKVQPDITEQVMCDKFGFLVNCDQRATTRLAAQRAVGRHVVREERRYAYATLIASNDLIPAALAFSQSLRLTGSVHDLVLMVDDVSREVDLKDPLLLRHFDHVRKVPSVANKYGVRGFSKLNAWLLEDYSKVVYIDVDTLVLMNLDHLFEHPEPTAVPDVYMSGKFNSGLLVLKPSRATYSDMLSRIDKLPSYNKGDQGFLNAYYSGWFHMPASHRLPARYNAVIFFPEHYHPPDYFHVDSVHQIMGPLAVVHFANPWFKPWRLGDANGSANAASSMPSTPSSHSSSSSSSSAAAASSSLPLSPNLWCSLWLRLSQALEANSWQPLDADAFSLIDFLPNKDEYEALEKNPHLLTLPRPMVALHSPHIPHLPPRHPYIGREAFVTVVTQANYFASAVWAMSYQQHHTFNSWRKTVLLVSSTITRSLWRPYRSLFNYVRVIDPIILNGAVLDDEFLILHVWKQKGFDKLVYIDPVAVFTDNCNELFGFEAFGALPSVFPPDMFSTRVMVVQPNETTFNDMMVKLHKMKLPKMSIDLFLNAYYFDWFQSASVHRMSPSFAVDMWFKEGLMKFFVPWKILIFDRRAYPWTDISDWMAHDRVKAVKLWRRTFCGLEEGLIPADLNFLCQDFI